MLNGALKKTNISSQDHPTFLKYLNWGWIYGIHLQKKSYAWRAVIRIEGYPTVCKTLKRTKRSRRLGKETERSIKSGASSFNKIQHTYADLIDRLMLDGAIEHLHFT